MGLIAKIKLLLKVRKPIEGLIKEVSKVKSGWKTSEFWMTVVSNLITIVGALKGVIPAETAAVIVAVLNGLYTIGRDVVKAKAGENA